MILVIENTETGEKTKFFGGIKEIKSTGEGEYTIIIEEGGEERTHKYPLFNL